MLRKLKLRQKKNDFLIKKRVVHLLLQNGFVLRISQCKHDLSLFRWILSFLVALKHKIPFFLSTVFDAS